MFSLQKPYPVVHSIKKRIYGCVLFGSFVFLFLFIFRPFGLNNLESNLFFITLGYGAICFFIMFFLNVVLFKLFSNFFSDEEWTTLKEILWTLLNVVAIGSANFIYTFFLNMTHFSFENIFNFIFYTVLIGVFPITFGIQINQNRLQKQVNREVDAISPLIEKEIKQTGTAKKNNLLVFQSENGISELRLLAENFIYAKSNDNYVEIVFLENNLRSRKLVRNTFKNIALILPQNDSFVQCHRCYIVNLSMVIDVSGNAQGLKLSLNKVEDHIPVSRSKIDLIKNYFATRH